MYVPTKTGRGNPYHNDDGKFAFKEGLWIKMEPIDGLDDDELNETENENFKRYRIAVDEFEKDYCTTMDKGHKGMLHIDRNNNSTEAQEMRIIELGLADDCQQ